MPVNRTAGLIGDFFGLSVSEAAVQSPVGQALDRLQSTVKHISHALIHGGVAHADETVLRATKPALDARADSASLTWLGLHATRGLVAFDCLGLLALFKGPLNHAGRAPYRLLALSQHALYDAHHLRELTYLHEQLGQVWAKNLIDLLVAA